MIRDNIIERLPLAFERAMNMRETGVTYAECIAKAKAIRLDADALALIQHYRYEIEKTGLEAFAKGIRLSWPRLWVEFTADDGKEQVGYYLEENDLCFFVMRFTVSPDGVFLPPLSHLVVRKPDFVAKNHPQATVGSFDLSSPEKADEVMSEVRSQGQSCFDILIDCGIMCAIMATPGVMRIEPEQAPGRTQRRRAEREGRALPASRVCRLDLDDLGRRDLEMRNGSHDETEAKGKVRMHWVRGHMFLARNGIMTYRRPHLRGAGEMASSTLEMTASSMSEANAG